MSMAGSDNAGRRRLLAGRMRSWMARYGIVTALIGLCALLSIVAPNFLTIQNWIILIRQISINGILAVGVTYVLLAGGVDLSLGSMLALAGVVAASFAHPGQYPLIIPILAGVATGMLGGTINGLIVTRGKVAPFIVTLGMMSAARGLALVVSGGKPVSNLSGSFISIGSSDWLGIPIPIVILLLVTALSFLLLANTRLGRYIYAVGGNENAARASGIHVGAIKIFTYAMSGAMAGLAGVVLASRITTGQPNAGLAYELDAIAAVVIGGTSLSGGVGGVVGTIQGSLLMGVINNGLDLMNMPSYYQQIVKGTIIVGAVWMDKRE